MIFSGYSKVSNNNVLTLRAYIFNVSGTYTKTELEAFNRISKRFNYEFNLDSKSTFEPVGCEHCNNTGFYERIAAVEMLSINDDIKDLIIQDGTITDIRKAAFETGYRPLVVDALNKVLEGRTVISEVKRKIGL